MARRIDTYLKDLLSEERFDFYSMVRDFSDNEIAPKILQWERDKILLPDECVAAMGKLGLFGIPIDETYVGQGGDDTDLLLMGLPRVGLELFHAKGNALGFGVEADHLHLDRFADLKGLGRMVDAPPGDVGDVQSPSTPPRSTKAP